MGNRAVIGFASNGKQDKNNIGIYLHWNGGRDSVEGFLETAKQYDVRFDNYGVARLIQIICNTLDGTLGVGVDIIKNLDCDNYDNGLYWINEKLEIIGREYNQYPEQKEYPLNEFVEHCQKSNNIHFKNYMERKGV